MVSQAVLPLVASVERNPLVLSLYRPALGRPRARGVPSGILLGSSELRGEAHASMGRPPHAEVLGLKLPGPAGRVGAVAQRRVPVLQRKLRSAAGQHGRLHPPLGGSGRARGSHTGPKSAWKGAKGPPQGKAHGLTLATTAPSTRSSQTPLASEGTVQIRTSLGRKMPLATRGPPLEVPFRG